MEPGFYQLQDGNKIPRFGLGTWMIRDQESMDTAVQNALDSGYRLVDTALTYTNEALLGRALVRVFNKGTFKRQDIVISTKVGMVDQPEMHVGVRRRFQKSLTALQLDYIDLYIIHNPINMPYNDDDMIEAETLVGETEPRPSDIIGMWKELELLVDEGLVKSIGVSNFNVDQLQRVQAVARHPVCVNQVELHVYLQEGAMINFCKQNGVIIMGYSPLGSAGTPEFKTCVDTHNTPLTVEDALIKKLAVKYNKTPAQICLRCVAQLGDVTVLVKSTNPERIRQNIDIYNFAIDEDDMAEVRKLEKGIRYFHFNGFRKFPEFPF